MVLDKNVEAFMIHIAAFSLKKFLIYPPWEAEIVLLIVKKVAILAKYLDYANVFL